MNKKVVLTIVLTVTIACCSVSAGIITAKCLNDKSIRDSLDLETSVDFTTEQSITDPALGDMAKDILQLPDLSNLKAIGLFETAPLPEKYMSNITCSQGLRSEISAVDAGGAEVAAGFHNAWDIACPEGTPVYSMKEGYIHEVWPSYYNGPYAFKGHPSYGGYIEIIHPDHTFSRYAHLSFTDVKSGQYVKEGQQIGRSGGVKGKRGSGKSTGPHLHVEVNLDMNVFAAFTKFIK